MCVAVPGKVEWIGDPLPNTIPARVGFGSNSKMVDLVMVPEAALGDYVIVHSGYAIRKLDSAEAATTLELLNDAQD